MSHTCVKVCAGRMHVFKRVRIHMWMHGCAVVSERTEWCVSLFEFPWVSFLWHSSFGEPIPVWTFTPPIPYPEADGHRHAVAFSPGLAGTDLVYGIHNSFSAPPPFLPQMKFNPGRSSVSQGEAGTSLLACVHVCKSEFNSVQAPPKSLPFIPFFV